VLRDVIDRVAELPDGTVVVEGEALGVDTLARQTAEARGLAVEPHPVRDDLYRAKGRAAVAERRDGRGRPRPRHRLLGPGLPRDGEMLDHLYAAGVPVGGVPVEVYVYDEREGGGRYRRGAQVFTPA
jgi:hypothetical protein